MDAKASPAATVMWTDRAFFQNTVNLVFGTLGDKVPQDFIEDREKLRGGKFDIAAMKAAIPQMRDQFRAHMQWIETQLGEGKPMACRRRASLVDVNAYMNVWYVREKLPGADAHDGGIPPRPRMGSPHARDRPRLAQRDVDPPRRWRSPRAATPLTGDGDRPQRSERPKARRPRRSRRPTTTDRIKVAGEIVALSAQHIAIRRQDPLAGEVVVHFPRAGFHVTSA